MVVNTIPFVSSLFQSVYYLENAMLYDLYTQINEF
jgi:hypothetical protein